MRNFLLGGDQKEFSNYYAYAIFAKLSRKRTANVTKKPRERFTDNPYGIGTELRSGWSVFLLCVVKRAS